MSVEGFKMERLRPNIKCYMMIIISVFIFSRIKKGEGQGKEGVTLKL